jgi:glycosyltransferase involved in cell wall biosynthesis
MPCSPNVSRNSNSVTPDASTVLVVVPAYNEAACITAVVTSVRAQGYPCVVVDDASTDTTAALAAEAGATVLRLPINLGVGGALRTGFRYAVEHGYRVVVQLDGDGQHPANAIDALLGALRTSGADLVIGSRFLHPDPPPISAVRAACIGLLARIIARSGHTTVTDPTSGCRAIAAPLLDAFAHDFPHHYLGDTFEAVLVAARRGYRITEIPVAMRPRQGGTPSADGFASFQAMVRACTVLFTGTTFDLAPRPVDNAPTIR